MSLQVQDTNLEPTSSPTTLKLSKLTKLERRWFKEYLQCFNSTDSLRRAYPNNTYGVESQRSIASLTKKSVFTKLNIGDNELLDMMGLSDEKLHKKLFEKLDAKKAMVVDGKPFQVDDHQAQLKALELSYKLRGRLSDRVELTGKDGEPLSIKMLAGIGFLNPVKDIDR